MMAALLSIDGLSKRYGDATVLSDVTLDVGRGEFFALLGPSGCGKTTLMRCIAGFETPDAGVIRLNGHDLAGEPPHRRSVNMMFQSYALFPHLNVFDNIAFGLRRKGASKETTVARVAELLEMTQLPGFGARRIDALSGGQRQRVALARALAPGPDLLLLDEPLGALDRKLREETQFHLKEIQRKTGASFMIVTHDQDEALALADRIAVMRDGLIEQIAPPLDIYARPATRFVAGFVGETNFIDGRFALENGGYFVASFGRIARPQGNLPDGARATLAVRPEQLIILKPDASADAQMGDPFDGRVEDFVFRGDSTLVRVRMSGGSLLRVAARNGGFTIGETVRIAVPATAGVIFAEEP
jgi:putrescine transport system ATP-binding protein